MDDDQAHFLILVGEVCKDARLAGLPVEVITDEGRHVSGLADPRDAAGPGEVDGTGWAEQLVVGGEHVDLQSIAEIRVRSPAARGR